jgi:uncharacterized membrane protein SirB2
MSQAFGKGVPGRVLLAKCFGFVFLVFGAGILWKQIVPAGYGAPQPASGAMEPIVVVVSIALLLAGAATLSGARWQQLRVLRILLSVLNGLVACCGLGSMASAAIGQAGASEIRLILGLFMIAGAAINVLGVGVLREWPRSRGQDGRSA